MAEGINAMSKMKVVLLTGFLGAGKTTLLNRMLSYLNQRGVNTAILINDFGKINIDKELIDDRYYKSVYEVSQGSVFCVCTRDKFFSALGSIMGTKPQFDILAIEATGIANTADLNEYLEESDYFKKINIIENICLIDALNFHKVFTTLPAVKSQVREASICVINKTDIAEDAGIDINMLEKTIRSLNRNAEIIKTTYGDIDFSRIFEKAEFKKWVTDSRLSGERPGNIYSLALESEGFIKTGDLKEFISSLGPLLRLKGFFENTDGSFLIEQIGGQLSIKPFHKDISRKNRIVLIGGKMDENRLLKNFQDITSNCR
jgi:G3E family GTPase